MRDTGTVSTPRLARASVSVVVRVRAALVCLVALALGCASAPWRRDRVGITLDELRAGAPLGVGQDSPALVDEEEVLAVSAEMQDFLDAHVARTAGRVTRLRQLARAIVGEGRFGLEYDETTRTASGDVPDEAGQLPVVLQHVRGHGPPRGPGRGLPGGGRPARLVLQGRRLRPEPARQRARGPGEGRRARRGLQHGRLQDHLRPARDLGRAGAGALLQQPGRRAHAGG